MYDHPDSDDLASRIAASAILSVPIPPGGVSKCTFSLSVNLDGSWFTSKVEISDLPPRTNLPG